jgi:hypothetical protein
MSAPTAEELRKAIVKLEVLLVRRFQFQNECERVRRLGIGMDAELALMRQTTALARERLQILRSLDLEAEIESEVKRWLDLTLKTKAEARGGDAKRHG